MANKTMNEFLQQVGTLLYRYLRKRGLTHEDAEDIVQDTCYKFLLHQNGIGADHVTSWLYRVATNQFYDLKRKERRYQAADVDADSLLSLTHMPEMSYLQKEQRASIREALEPFSPLHPWWWVDAYTDERLAFMGEEQETVTANSSFLMNGFHTDVYQPEGAVGYGGVTDFISHLEQLRTSKHFHWEIEQIYEAIAGDNDQIEEEKISIIGAVVTGTPDQLSALQDQPYIQASTFGVITEQKQLNSGRREENADLQR